MYDKKTLIKSTHCIEETTHAAEIPAFNEFRSNEPIQFIGRKFDDYFHDLIGFPVIEKFQLIVDLKNRVLRNDSTSIPIHLFYPNQPNTRLISDQYLIEPLSASLVQIHTDIFHGNIPIQQQMTKNNLLIPEQIITAITGKAIIEIRNNNI